MTSALSITLSANPSRSVFLDYPLGHTAGPPDDAATQLDIMRQTMAGFAELTEPGSLGVLPHVWPTEWKTKARELNDKRSDRLDTPQYERQEDLEAAVEIHGEDAACTVCVS